MNNDVVTSCSVFKFSANSLPEPFGCPDRKLTQLKTVILFWLGIFVSWFPGDAHNRQFDMKSNESSLTHLLEEFSCKRLEAPWSCADMSDRSGMKNRIQLFHIVIIRVFFFFPKHINMAVCKRRAAPRNCRKHHTCWAQFGNFTSAGLSSWTLF